MRLNWIKKCFYKLETALAHLFRVDAFDLSEFWPVGYLSVKAMRGGKKWAFLTINQRMYIEYNTIQKTLRPKMNLQIHSAAFYNFVAPPEALVPENRSSVTLFGGGILWWCADLYLVIQVGINCTQILAQKEPQENKKRGRGVQTAAHKCGKFFEPVTFMDCFL
jgi:hypothetical protein